MRQDLSAFHTCFLLMGEGSRAPWQGFGICPGDSSGKAETPLNCAIRAKRSFLPNWGFWGRGAGLKGLTFLSLSGNSFLPH